MIICAIKLTHDGSIALVDHGTLIFCYEMEKLDNGYRHWHFNLRMHQIEHILSTFGYEMSDIDKWAIDGWRGEAIGEECFLPNVSLFYDYERPFQLANYGHLVREGDDLMEMKHFNLHERQFGYDSFLHVTTHIFAGYCTSSFSQKNEASYVLVWDGDMPPQLFHYQPGSNKIQVIGALFYLAGAIYKDLARQFKPYSDYHEFDLSIPGKVMAYIALGEIRADITSAYQEAYQQLLLAESSLDLMDHPAVCRITSSFTKKAKDLAEEKGCEPVDMMASMQAFLDNQLIESLEKKVENNPTLTRNLCIVGGCALNIKWNGSIRGKNIFNEVWVPPFPNDAGNGIGAACASMVTHSNTRTLAWDVYSGPQFIQLSEAPKEYVSSNCTLKELAKIIHDKNEPILFLNGRAELGPRALGNRSILAAATSPEMKTRLNEVKNREDYRPVAPICLEAHAEEIFSPGTPDPFMLFEHQVKPHWIDKIPAIVHLDNTARLQTINSKRNKPIYDLLTFYHELSGIPLLCNTSANLNGRGFFPDLESAIKWGQVNYIWSDGVLYSKDDPLNK